MSDAMNAARIRADRLVPADLEPPLSKSDALRALVLGDITGSDVILPADSELPTDIRVLRAGLKALRDARGAELITIDCADGGAPLRFLIAQAALPPRRTVRFTGTTRLGERPRAALLTSLTGALGEHGLSIQDAQPWPLDLTGATTSGEPTFVVDASESGQFASAVLLAAARMAAQEGRSWTVELRGGVTSAGYVDLTAGWLQRAGFSVTTSPSGWTVGKVGLPNSFTVPGDWSSLGYLLAIAWKTGSRIRRADLEAAHPDRAIVDVLRQSGAEVARGKDGSLQVSGKLTGHLTASGSECPDLLPTLAAISCGTGVPAVFSNVGILRAKESDRVEGIQRLVAAARGSTELRGESLAITPPTHPPDRLTLDSAGDHRLAMSAAVLSVLTGAELTLTNPDCVTKSFPGFWAQLARVGVTREPA